MMSSDGEEQFAMDQLTVMDRDLKKKSKISYTKDFLLSLSELDACKKLPSGFDQSLLSEFEDASQDRPRIPGGSSLQGYRRNDYGSSPPTRGDSGSYSRGVQGRWDTRSAGRSDKDSDLQSERDPDSGRRYGQSRRSWQGPEHDGLLGSGSSPRPSGFAAGASGPKIRTNDQYQLNRSNEPYQPPRPYKAFPHSRRDTDAFNDETFGSSDSTNEDRAEEETKRRAAFELLRKDQHKVLQEKQNSNAESRNDYFDISTLIDDDKNDKGLASKSNELVEPVVLSAGNSEPVRPIFQSQTSAPRPLVPPGFSSAILDRNSGTRTSGHPNPSEMGNSEVEIRPLHLKDSSISSGTSGNLEEKSRLVEQQLGNKGINSVSNQTDKLDTSTLSMSFDASENSAAGGMGNKIGDVSGQGISASILDKLFNSAVTPEGGGTSSLIEPHDGEVDDVWGPGTVQSSKFAKWFSEEAERKPLDGFSSGRPSDLLSLIGGGENVESKVSDVNVLKHDTSKFPFQSTELVARYSSDSYPAAVEHSEPFNTVDRTGAVPPVLTCEDLEQSILSEICEKDTALPQLVQDRSVPDEEMKHQKPDIDNHASHHLLLLLQKGPGVKEKAPSPILEIQVPDILHGAEAASNSMGTNAENVAEPGKPLGLETLFGHDFLKGLQSTGAPVSTQRGPVGSARLNGSDVNGLPFSGLEDRLLPSTGDTGSNKTGYNSSILASNQRDRTKSDGTEGHLLGFDSSQLQMDPSQLIRSEHGGFHGFAGIRIPEEESFMAIRNPINHENIMPARSSARQAPLPSQDTAADIAEKLALLSSGFRDERSVVRGQEGPLFHRGPYDSREPNMPFHNPHMQTSSPQLHHPQLNHVGQLYHQLDSHPSNLNSRMKFMAPDVHRDSPPNQQYLGRMIRPPFHHQSSEHTGFDPSASHPILQQMQRPGNFPPPQLLRGFPGGTALPSHSSNQGPGFLPEVNPMQGFPFSQQQHNFPGLGMPSRAPEVGGGSNHPEAFQRLIKGELGSKSRQMHPFAAATGGRNQGSHGHELDMGFGYR